MVNKIAFLFPGQGSQYVGMGKADAAWPTAKILLSKASAALGFDLTQIMFEGPEDRLRETDITQPALFLASALALERLREKGIHPHFAAGHSLGEYSALYAAGVLDFETALNLVFERGKAMKEAAASQPGSMAAILGLNETQLTDICAAVPSSLGPCTVANINSDSQTVISGTKEAVLLAMQKAKEKGALKTIPLNVSGAFHSPLMARAVQTMGPIIEKAAFGEAAVPVITNVDADPTTNPSQIKEKLIEQIDHPVRWNATMKKLIILDCGTFIEVGAGSVLSTLMKKCDRTKSGLRTDDFGTIEKAFTQPSPSI